MGQVSRAEVAGRVIEKKMDRKASIQLSVFFTNIHF
jgi:hypothetical protein